MVDLGKSFDLLDYVGEEMPEEDYNKEQEEYEQWRLKQCPYLRYKE